jgi:hypothetical protein
MFCGAGWRDCWIRPAAAGFDASSGDHRDAAIDTSHQRGDAGRMAPGSWPARDAGRNRPMGPSEASRRRPVEEQCQDSTTVSKTGRVMDGQASYFGFKMACTRFGSEKSCLIYIFALETFVSTKGLRHMNLFIAWLIRQLRPMSKERDRPCRMLLTARKKYNVRQLGKTQFCQARRIPLCQARIHLHHHGR